MFDQFRLKQRGFTLIELLIAITIIGILSATLIPRVVNIVPQARDASRKAALNDLIAAVEAYNLDYGQYPDVSFCLTNVDADQPADIDTGRDGDQSVADFIADYLRGTAPEFSPVQPAGVTCNDSIYYDAPASSGNPYNYAVLAPTELGKTGNFGAEDAAFDGDNADVADLDVEQDRQYFAIIR